MPSNPENRETRHRFNFSKLEGLKPPVDLEAANLRVFERLKADRAAKRAARNISMSKPDEI